MFSSFLNLISQYSAMNFLKENNYCIRIDKPNQTLNAVKQTFIMVFFFDNIFLNLNCFFSISN